MNLQQQNSESKTVCVLRMALRYSATIQHNVYKYNYNLSDTNSDNPMFILLQPTQNKEYSVISHS